MTERETRENQENPALAGMHTGTVILIAALVALLGAGFAATIGAGYRVGPYAAYGAGLTCIAVAASVGVGAGAIFLHRLNLKDGERTRQLAIDTRQEILAALLATRQEILAALLALSKRVGGIEEFEEGVVQHAMDELDSRRPNGHGA